MGFLLLFFVHNIGIYVKYKRLIIYILAMKGGICMKKMAIKNDIVKNLKTKLSDQKIKISFGNKIGLGYDGCGTHTHK